MHTRHQSPGFRANVSQNKLTNFVMVFVRFIVDYAKDRERKREKTFIVSCALSCFTYVNNMNIEHIARSAVPSPRI